MNACPVCSSSTTLKVTTLSGSRTGQKSPLYTCRNCSFFWQRPSYSEDEAVLKADLEWHVSKSNAGHYALQVEDVIKQLLEIKPDAKTMLDIGCGIGTTLLVGKTLGLECFGVEPNSFACEYARQNSDLNIVEGYFSQESFGRKFDLIILDMVLEHVPHPQKFMQEVFSVLKPSGLLYIAVPGNKGGIARVLLSLLNTKSRISIFQDNDVHINHFFPKTIEHLSSANNSEIIRKVRSGAYILQRS